MLTGLDLYNLWDKHDCFEEFQAFCFESLDHYTRPYDRSSIIHYEKGQRYTCYRVSANMIYFMKDNKTKDGSNDYILWDKFIEHFTIPALTRDDIIDKVLSSKCAD